MNTRDVSKEIVDELKKEGINLTQKEAQRVIEVYQTIIKHELREGRSFLFPKFFSLSLKYIDTKMKKIPTRDGKMTLKKVEGREKLIIKDYWNK